MYHIYVQGMVPAYPCCRYVSVVGPFRYQKISCGTSMPHFPFIDDDKHGLTHKLTQDVPVDGDQLIRRLAVCSYGHVSAYIENQPLKRFPHLMYITDM